MSAIRRRNDIVLQVKHNGNVTVEQLVDKYEVSVETIRRDLRILDEKGMVRRTYGGAVMREQTTWDLPFNERMMLHYEQKNSIAKEAVLLLENGDSVFIDGNTTCYTLSHYIPPEMELMIVTNSPAIILNMLQMKSRSKLFLIGGEVSSEGMTTGYKLHQELKQYRFDKAFFSCMGISTQGCFFSKIDPLQVAQTLAEQSKKLILVADSSKMNRSGFLFGLETKRVDVLVTDSGTPTKTVDKLKECIRNVIVSGDEIQTLD